MVKKILFFICILISTFSASAQIDISRFNKVGEPAISAILNCPNEIWGETDIDGYPKLGSHNIYGYGPSGCVIIIDPYSKELKYFSTESTNYYMLPDIVPGGIRVGMKLSDLEKIDFVNTRYGRGKNGNALKLIQIDSDGEKEYGIFYEEYQDIILYVKNGIVTSFIFSTSEGDIEYDKSLSLFE